jgi:UDP-glucose 4-epimerase
MAKILIVGGAGYIGAHMVNMLVENKHEVHVLDNLSKGHREAVQNANLIIGDLSDTKTLEKVFTQNKFDAVMHFAAFIQVGESVINPAIYYRNNVANTLNLLETMLQYNVKNFIFSSSAAVYGEPQYTPIDINHPKNPVNPYGKSKWMLEQILEDFDKAYNLRFVALRYFNAAGADPLARIGELHNPETHLIPLVLQVASGKRKEIELYGDDYDTKDGTCVRDYIHVVDLCSAHLLALLSLLQGNKSNVYNLGNGAGYTVLEVIKIAEEVTGRPIPVKKAPRRAGDPAVLVADATRAIKELNWKPRYADLRTIIQHAWQWEQKR